MSSIGDHCYRDSNGVATLSLPFRIIMPDGTTRTDPSQWWQDEAARQASGYTESTLTQEDLDLLFPPPPEPTWLEAGYDTGLGWRLAWTAEDVGVLTGLYVLAKELNELAPEQTYTVTDMAGEKHSLTFAELKTLMTAYGTARAAASAGDP